MFVCLFGKRRLLADCCLPACWCRSQATAQAARRDAHGPSKKSLSPPKNKNMLDPLRGTRNRDFTPKSPTTYVLPQKPVLNRERDGAAGFQIMCAHFIPARQSARGVPRSRRWQILVIKESAASERFQPRSVISPVPHWPLSGGQRHPNSHPPSRVERRPGRWAAGARALGLPRSRRRQRRRV